MTLCTKRPTLSSSPRGAQVTPPTPGRPTSVLVIRTLQSDLLPELLEVWREQLPGAEFDLLTHPAQHSQAEGCFDGYINYEAAEDFSWWRADWPAIRDLHYDLAIIPHHQQQIEGFENVLLMLALFGVKQWAHCGPDGRLRPVSKLRAVRALATALAALGPAAALYAGYLATLLLQVKPWRNS